MAFSRLIFRQLFDPQSSTYTYLLGDAGTGHAVLIDPVLEQVRRDLAQARDLELKVIATLDTHVHADHVTGAAAIQDRVGSEILISAASGAEGADRLLLHGDHVTWGTRYLVAKSTPGHTAGCMTFVLDDQSIAFSGDCLLIRSCGRTDFQGGSALALFTSVHQEIFTLDANCLIYPAHDYRGLSVTTVGEERRYNPRLGGDVSLRDFTGYMDNLGLAHPKKIAEAVPANLACGRPTQGTLAMSDPSWGELSYTFAGIWEIDTHWLEEHLAEVQVLDVREMDEYVGPLGHIQGSRLIPLGQLGVSLKQLDTARPVVTVCRAGSRSAQATVILSNAGFKEVASLAGGMLRWRSRGHPVVGGQS